MKERPILFSGSMVRAILDGSKTQTRRKITSITKRGPVTEFQPSTTPGYDFIMRDKRMLWNDFTTTDLLVRCPYGVPGDRLWVREAWRTLKSLDSMNAGEIEDRCTIHAFDVATVPIVFCADSERRNWPSVGVGDSILSGRYRHGRFMPRWASRLTLEIASVRVERLQDISEEDAKAEGVESWRYHWSTKQGMEMALRTGAGEFGDIQKQGVARTLYRALWESINGPGSWESNPWVWGVEFKKVEANQ